jgi:cephalosporin hydroxylase
VSVDIDHSKALVNLAGRDPGYAETISLIEGDVCDPQMRAQVGQLIGTDDVCMVVEDSAHVYATTEAALRLYCDLVPLGGYFVVEDGCIDVEWMRVKPEWPRGVLPALGDWLQTAQGSDFTVRRDIEAYGITCHPSGFLQRVA